jgi:hypothetical protein
MKAMKMLMVISLLSVSLLAIPMTSRAGIIGNIISAIENALHHDHDKDPKKGTGGNSVPLDGGIVLLGAAALALGASKLYGRKKLQLVRNTEA